MISGQQKSKAVKVNSGLLCILSKKYTSKKIVTKVQGRTEEKLISSFHFFSTKFLSLPDFMGKKVLEKNLESQLPLGLEGEPEESHTAFHINA